MRATMLLGLLVAWFVACPASGAEEAWPGFRGRGDGRSQAADPPLEWAIDSNVAWRTALTGYGQSSPVVWGSATYVTSVDGADRDRLIVTCIDAETGTKKWEKTFQGTRAGDGPRVVAGAPPGQSDNYVSKAAPTPVVDATGIGVFFETGDLLSLSHDGAVRWRRSLTDSYGPFTNNHGLGSSLSQTDDALLALVAQGGGSYLLCIDKGTGKNRWKVDRAFGSSWSSPVVVEHDSGSSVIVSCSGSVEAFDAADGRELWKIDGVAGNTVASPTPAKKDLVLIGSSAKGSNFAVRPGGAEKSAADRVAWRSDEVTTSFGSPVASEKHAYFVSRAGIAYCVELATGKLVRQARLGDSCWATPIVSGARVYFFTKGGKTVVYRTGPTFEKIAENLLPTESRVYGVAPIDGAFLVRTGSRLTRIGVAQGD